MQTDSNTSNQNIEIGKYHCVTMPIAIGIITLNSGACFHIGIVESMRKNKHQSIKLY
jgi:hypothetical protein